MALKIITTIADPLFQSNSYIVYCSETGEGVISDPGKPETFEHILNDKNIALKAIINTHGHLDHISGAAMTRDKFRIPFRIAEGDHNLVREVNTFTSGYGLPEMQVPQLDEPLVDGERIKVGQEEIEIIATPGHSPGGVCIYFPGHLITGDTLFQGSIGRTDLPGGDYDTLISSIKNKILTLPGETRVYPGHGPASTVAAEAAGNPFLQD